MLKVYKTIEDIENDKSLDPLERGAWLLMLYHAEGKPIFVDTDAREVGIVEDEEDDYRQSAV